MKISKVFLTLILTFFIVSCSTNSTEVGGEIDYGNITDIDYGAHVQPLLDEYAEILNSNGTFPAGLQMNSWENLVQGWERGEVVIPFDADNSLLVELMTKLDNQTVLEDVKLEFLKRWINEGARNDAGEVPYANVTDLLYVCSQGEAIINVIDMNSLQVIRNIKMTDEGYPAFSKPHFIEFTPNGSHFFVSCIDNTVNKIVKYSTSTHEAAGEISTDIPALMEHHPTEDVLYVSRFMLNNTLTSIFAFDSGTLQPAETGNEGNILLPNSLSVPHAIAVGNNGDYIYSASFTEDALVIIDNATKEFEGAVPLGTDTTPLDVTISPDNSRAYISCIGSGEMIVVNISDPNNRFVESRIALEAGSQPWHSVFNSDGSKLYVSDLATNKFHVITTATGAVQSFGAGDGSDGLSMPHGIEISADDSRVFISNRNISGNYQSPYQFNDSDNAKVGTVVVVNTADNSIEKIIEIENFGSGMKHIPR